MTSAAYELVDVFAEGPFTGNPLAVFPNGDEVPSEWMPRIARELNLSETAFVTGRRGDEYDVRIFSLAAELPFAGHPTIGTSWVLHRLGILGSLRIIQRSPGGRTAVTISDGTVWFERAGSVLDQAIDAGQFANALGIGVAQIAGQSFALGGHSFRPRPSVANAGLSVVLLPVDREALMRLIPATSFSTLTGNGIYCWTVAGPDVIKARFFAPSLGVTEDPATGSAAAALGVYLATQLGEARFEIRQGAEIGRPSRILVEASTGKVRVGGAVAAVGHGTIDLPQA